MFLPRLVTPPTALPVTTQEVKLNLGIETSKDDFILGSFISSVTSRLDGYNGYLGRCILQQTWAQDFEYWPAEKELALPFPDCSSAVVTYRDINHANQTFDSANFKQPVDEDDGSELYIYPGVTLPTLSIRPAPLTVTFVTGLAASPSAVPQAIKHAIIMEVSALYRSIKRDPTVKSETVYNVGAVTYDTSSAALSQNIHNASNSLLAKYRIERL